MNKFQWEQFEREQRRQWGEIGDAIYKDRERSLILTETEKQIQQDMEEIRQRTAAMTYHDVPPREMRKEEAEKIGKGTLSVREENLLIKGHMAYLEQKINTLLSKKGKKYVKYE